MSGYALANISNNHKLLPPIFFSGEGGDLPSIKLLNFTEEVIIVKLKNVHRRQNFGKILSKNC